VRALFFFLCLYAMSQSNAYVSFAFRAFEKQ
jgi:hypothetical protein